MEIVPSVDVVGGRSRLVFWPGASTGTGSPTDRPERIARAFVDLGAPMIHVVDLDGARMGQPAALDVVGRIAREVAVPLQVAGGADGPDQIRLLFAAGATRVVVPLLAVAEDPERLRACLDVAGSWLAVGLDPRPERLREHRWRSGVAPSVGGLVESLAWAGVQRFVLTHGGSRPDLDGLAPLAAARGVELLVAGGVDTLDGVRRLRQAGIGALIVGEALLSGRLDYRDAVSAAAAA